MDCPAGEVAVNTPSGKYLIWACSNLSGNGSFATWPTDYGCLFQWGYTNVMAGNPTNSVNTVTQPNSTASSKTSWTSSGVPCPSPWRLPTRAEFGNLLNSTYATNTWDGTSGSRGMRVVSRLTGGTVLFPCVGLRVTGTTYSDGSTYIPGYYGHYWSSDQYTATYGYLMRINHVNATGWIDVNDKLNAAAVRCVRDNK